MNADAAATVRLLVYSGVPDPEWTLGADELEALAERARRSLGGAGAEPPAPWRLGYRGFLVRAEQRPAGLPAQFRVAHGALIVPEDGHETARRDEGGVEELLLEQAVRRGHGELLTELGVRLPPPRATSA